MGARIAFKAVADAGGKAVTLVVAMVAARTLAADAFGVLAVAMTTGWLIGIATDAGLSMYLARETARHPAHARALFGAVMWPRASAAAVGALLVALAAGAMVPDAFRLAFFLIVAAQIVGAVLETAFHLFRGLERSEYESAIQLAQRATTLVVALAILYWSPRLDYLGAALLVPPAIALVVALARAKALALQGEKSNKATMEGDGFPGLSEVEGSRRLSLRGFVGQALPLGAATLISALYFRCDLYFVERWQGLEAAGSYNAVFRLIEAMRLLPAAVMAVTFPILCKAADTRALQRIAGALTLAGIVLMLVATPFAALIVRTVYGASFASAAPTFAVLALALPLLFLNYALTHQVIGWDGQRKFLWISTAALAANVAANLWLVPDRGMIGAAWATIITELVVTAGCVVSLRAWPVLPSTEVGVA